MGHSEEEKCRSQLLEDEMVSKFLTKTTPSLLNGIRNVTFCSVDVIFFEEYLQEKKHLFIS